MSDPFGVLVDCASAWEDIRGDGNAAFRWEMVALLDMMRDAIRQIEDDNE